MRTGAVEKNNGAGEQAGGNMKQTIEIVPDIVTERRLRELTSAFERIAAALEKIADNGRKNGQEKLRR